jgi:hypothetical protein
MPATAREPLFHLELVREIPSAASAAASEPVEVDLDSLSRGVRLRAEGCGWRAAIGERDPIGHARPSAALEIPLSDSLRATIAPGAASLEVADPHVGRARGGDGTVDLVTAGRELGAAIEGTFRATLPMTPGSLRVDGRFRTFVRDVDPLPAACGAAAEPPR